MNVDVITRKEFQENIQQVYNKLSDNIFDTISKQINRINERLNDIEIILSTRIDK